MGLVSKSQSTWTLIYPTGFTYSRPSLDAYIRFKLTSTQQDFVTYDVIKQMANSFHWILVYFYQLQAV
jgi:hypothetical protein